MNKFCRMEKPYFEFLHCDVLKSNCHFFVWPYTWCGWEAKVDLWAPKFFLSSLDFLELHEYQSLWRFHQSMESSKKYHFHVFSLCLLTKAHNPYRGWKCPIGSNNVTPVSLKPQRFSHFQYWVAIGQLQRTKQDLSLETSDNKERDNTYKFSWVLHLLQ